jgi:hypothetical protein
MGDNAGDEGHEDKPEDEEKAAEDLTDFYQDILQPLADLDPFASTVIMQLTKKRALNTEDEIYAHTYTDEREKELIR